MLRATGVVNVRASELQYKGIRPMAVSFPKTGDLFEGRYRIGPMIGAGGFARVYKANQEDLGREVALKILTPPKEGTYDAKIVDRFNQEARLVSKLRDPRTITMFDFGRSADGLLYMVFEYVNGVSLSHLISSSSPLKPARVVKILEQILSSLEEAHALGVLHRDIKPGNVMVFDHIGRADQVKLLDFGIAKLTGQDHPKVDLTADGALIGTPRYMSPEQIRGEELSPHSDIYSLGLVAYEMLIGKKAIESNSSVTIIGKQLDAASFTLPPITGVPPKLTEIVNKMLAKDRSARFGSAGEVIKALQNWDAIPVRAMAEVELDELPTARLPGAIPLDQFEKLAPPLTAPRPHFTTPVPRPVYTPAPMPAVASASGQFEVAPAQTGRSSALPIVVGIVALLVLLGGMFVWSQRAEEKTVVAEVLPAPVVEPAQEKPEPAVANDRRMVFRTTPTNLPITVNGRPGTSPATFREDELTFPVRLRIKADDKLSPEMIINDYAPDVVYDAQEFLASVQTPKVVDPVEPSRAPVSVKEDKVPTKSPRVSKKAAEPVQKNDDPKPPVKKPEDTKLNLPVLD
ncbi:MAG: serine/threonine-protein kinase [bacterium]